VNNSVFSSCFRIFLELYFKNYFTNSGHYPIMMQNMQIKKVVFFKPGAIGDFLQALPALQALKRKFPAAHITVVVSPGLDELIQGTSIADRVLVFDKTKFKKRAKDFIDFALCLKREQYDLFVDMQTSIRSLMIRAVNHAPRTLIYRKQKIYNPGTRRLHAAENFMETLRPLGIHEPVESIDLPLRKEANLHVDQFFVEQGVDQRKPLIALNCSVGSARPARNWFPDRFGELADQLIKDLNAQIVFVGGSEDRDVIQTIVSKMHKPAIIAAGCLSLSQSAALLARVACLISSDTGPLHLATAVGTRAIGLYGSTDPRRTGPVGKKHQIIIKNFSCVPCEKKECPTGTRLCMTEITVQDVFQAVQKALHT